MKLLQDPAVEMECLSAVFVDSRCLDFLAEHLSPDDFGTRVPRMVYQAMLDLRADGSAVDLVTVRSKMAGTGALPAIGGDQALSDLLDHRGTTHHLSEYVGVVRRLSRQRALLMALESISARMAIPLSDFDEVAAEAAKTVALVAAGGMVQHAMPMTSVVGLVVHEAEAAFDGKRGPSVKTGLGALDLMIGGYYDGDLVIVAGRPSMGKSVFGLSAAIRAAESGIGAVLFSLEMSSTQLGQRAVASEGRVNLTRIREGKLDDDDWPRFMAAAEKVNSLPMFIDDKAGVTLAHVEAESWRLKREHNIGFVVVDYLQLMASSGRSQEEEVAKLSKGLKQLAKELGVPVMAMSQLNRAVESRTDKRPTMSDLRYSGAIEQDADIVCLLYRDEYYNDSSTRKGELDIIVSKHRNGPTGTVSCRFLGANCRLDDKRMDAWE